jgi:hypothetical protein
MVSRSHPLRSPSWQRLAVHIALLAVMALALMPTLVRTVAFAQAGLALPFELCLGTRATSEPVASDARGDHGDHGDHAVLDACQLCVLAASAAAMPMPVDGLGHVRASVAAEPLPIGSATHLVPDLATSIARPRGPPLNA